MPGQLLDQHGYPIRSSDYTKVAPPQKGDAYGQWAGRDYGFLKLPTGSFVQFDLSKLTLGDFRTMSEYYQINSSLSVLSFMQHQSNWRIEHDNKQVVDFCTEVLTNIWTQLTRGMAQANWAGFSPNVLEWDNDVEGKRVVITKVKDLMPEECLVNWKLVDGYAPPGRIPPKFRKYDGIRQWGYPIIPTENTIWYPLLMENGDYYGRKLLRSAYTPYFFSMLMHLFANRYYERFGEPTPIGRVPFDETVDINGQPVNSRDMMMSVLQNLRNRGVVILPSDKVQDAGNTTRTAHWEYDIEYLESQMRGADFERYMTRLDQEMSLAMFTPVLLLQTADVGSYNLGTGHMQMYLWMLNALNDDRAMYINNYILAPLAMYNFTSNMKPPKIIFEKLGNTNQEMASIALQALIGSGRVMPDLDQLGTMLGLTLKETQVLKTPTGAGDPNLGDNNPDNSSGDTSNSGKGNSQNRIADVKKKIFDRVRPQVENASRNGKFGDYLRISMGHARQLEMILHDSQVRNADYAVKDIYANLEGWNKDMTGQPITDPNDYMREFERFFDYQLGKVLST